MLCQLGTEVYSCRAVSSSDYPYACGFLDSKAHEHGSDDCKENADLRCRTEQERYGVRKKRAKVSQSTYTHENDNRVKFVVDAELYEIEESARIYDAGKR